MTARHEGAVLLTCAVCAQEFWAPVAIDAENGPSDAEMRSPDVLASDALLISGPISKPANAEVIDADPVDESRLSPEAVTRILGIAKGKGIDATKLDSLIGGKLTEAPPSAELEILRQIRVAK